MKEKWPEAIRENAIEYGTVVFHGEMVPYAVLSREINRDLPGFVGCFKQEGESFFFISEDVPVEFRSPQVVHEVMEFKELGERPGSCLQSLMFELELLPEELREEYIPFRREFFRRLLPYCATHAQWYPAQRLRDFQESLDYLEKM
jgi:hypothetical protein